MRGTSLRSVAFMVALLSILAVASLSAGTPAANAEEDEANAGVTATDGATDGEDTAGVVGDLPPREGLSLVTSAGGTVEGILDAIREDGCHARAIFANKPGDGIVGYYVLAPEALNADFTAAWPDGVPAGQPMLVICVLESQLVVVEWAAHVCLAAQTFADDYAAAWDDKEISQIRALTVEERIERGGQLVPGWIAAARAAQASLDAIEAPASTVRYHATLVDLMGNLVEAWETSREQLPLAETADDIEALNDLVSGVRQAGEAASREAGLDLDRRTRTVLRGISPCGTVPATHALTGDVLRVPQREATSEEE